MCFLLSDIFLPNEPNPNLTNALESSLWELQSHKSHFHSGVSTLARIFEEAFTKPGYAMEDFLDHTYGTVCFFRGRLSVKHLPDNLTYSATWNGIQPENQKGACLGDGNEERPVSHRCPVAWWVHRRYYQRTVGLRVNFVTFLRISIAFEYQSSRKQKQYNHGHGSVSKYYHLIPAKLYCLFIVFISRYFCILLASLRHELRQILFFCLWNGLWLQYKSL